MTSHNPFPEPDPDVVGQMVHRLETEASRSQNSPLTAFLLMNRMHKPVLVREIIALYREWATAQIPADLPPPPLNAAPDPVRAPYEDPQPSDNI